MMTRYERVTTDCVPSSNGKKHSHLENGTFETKFKSRFEDHHHHSNHHNDPSCSPSHSDQRNDASPSRSSRSGGGGGGAVNSDVFFQWGQKKRARVSRSEIRGLADESSSSAQAKQVIKVPRRGESKLSTPPMAPPPPPPPPPPSNGVSRGGNFRKESSSSLPHRVLEKRSGSGNVSPSRNGGGSSSRVVSRSTSAKRSHPSPEKIDRKVPNSKPPKHEKPNGSIPDADHANNTDSTPAQSEQAVALSTFNSNTASIAAPAGGGGGGGEKWPRIYVSLSKKEKEDDFFAMKGTKLPQRPKKRAKNVDKTLQYCFPGMWLSDLTKSRYEVREKKCVKKPKRRGLKGMEGLESDSE
ncbi:uncharacterized protein LOC126674833 isoform X2 [Mercurialis annua]|uniref:uncharacterized protein LOC126674833 isoform X2 n=1 Tax=Mercurialis annua TaxID=3986 RepID=UPI00215FAAB1|nr:uncharacterized protein LOC126674833 isoform X2 [Mercurialis annua]